MEPCFIGFPLPKGKLKNTESVRVRSKENSLPVQVKATSRYDDDSIRFLFLRFLTDIPANRSLTLECDLNGSETACDLLYHPVSVQAVPNGYVLQTASEEGTFSIALENHSDHLFKEITAAQQQFQNDCFAGPILQEAEQRSPYTLKTGTWEVAEEGPVCAILKTRGIHTSPDSDKQLEFEVRITMWAGKPWAEVSYRLINTSPAPFTIQSLQYQIRRNDTETPARSCVANSNYKTAYQVSENGELVSRVIDAEWLMNEANEQFAEVYYGTFFADVTDEKAGICATVYQAHQNFPKALEADRNGINIMLVPEGAGTITMQSGMAREQKFLLHFHRPSESLESLNDRSIVYQMPYRPWTDPEVHQNSGVWPDIFTDQLNYKVEQSLVGRADAHSRAYGMLNFGDSYDPNYTAQGRGNGHLVWSNNEYDFPHACILLYVKTGIRRFLDYAIANCSHWMDIDVCHYHTDPLYIGGQWEHTAGHVINGVMVCSHQWVEGLLDYYHFTGDERGLETAIGIGRNIQRLLNTPAYAKVGEANARETGWALRTLTALYIETHDSDWLEKCDRIVNDFHVWEETYGHWLAPYTDNTLIRVGFMISVAIGSLMRYYRVFPSESLKQMILRQVDDLIENCYVKKWGIFYYKELPSLNRLGNNVLLLEALTAAYDLTGNSDYLTYGLETFKNAIKDAPGYTSAKWVEEDAVLIGKNSTKEFAKNMLPLAGYYRAVSESGMTIQ